MTYAEKYDPRYDKIRPYTDAEAVQAFPQVAATPYLQAVVRYAHPQFTQQEVVDWVSRCGSIRDFIGKIAYPSVELLMENTSEGLTFHGFDALDKSPYIFLSNHRDIVMDSVLLNYGLFMRNMPVAQSAIGNNLVPDEAILALARINKNFLVLRDLSPRDTLDFSGLLSEYIRDVLFKMGDSVWIAHREGRAKDGDDRTNPGILKMLAMAAQGENLIDYLQNLRIVPMAISYQWDATDLLKLRELLARSREVKYVKAEGEDQRSILAGVVGKKGKVNISVGQPFAEDLEPLRHLDNDARRIRAVAEMVDRRIHSLYRLFPGNYAACDLLRRADTYKARYTPADREELIDRVQSNAAAVGGGEEAWRIMLQMYATPVVNREKYDDGTR